MQKVPCQRKLDAEPFCIRRYAGVWGRLAPQRVQGGALPAGGISP